METVGAIKGKSNVIFSIFLGKVKIISGRSEDLKVP